MACFVDSGFSNNDRMVNFSAVSIPKEECLTHSVLPKPSSLLAMAQKTSERLPGMSKLDSAAENAILFTNNHRPRQAVITIRRLPVPLD